MKIISISFAVLVFSLFLGTTAGILAIGNEPLEEPPAQPQKPKSDQPPELNPELEKLLRDMEPKQAERLRSLLAETQTATSRVSRYCQIADSVKNFDGEPKQGTFGYFPESKNRIVKIVNPGTAIVVLRKIPIPIGITFESHVVIKGVDTAGYEDHPTILLNMPFEVTGTEKIGDQTYARLEAVEIRPVPMTRNIPYYPVLPLTIPGK